MLPIYTDKEQRVYNAYKIKELKNQLMNVISELYYYKNKEYYCLGFDGMFVTKDISPITNKRELRETALPAIFTNIDGAKEYYEDQLNNLFQLEEVNAMDALNMVKNKIIETISKLESEMVKWK